MIEPVNEMKRGGSVRGRWCVLWASVIAYLALFFASYPALPGIEDEIGFINQSIVWSRGAISAEGAGFESVADFTEAGGRHVSWRNPGRSLLNLPLYWIGGVKAMFVAGAIIHVGIAIVGGLLLNRLIGRPEWAVLLLAHPTLAIYSRTVMGDTAAALCLLLAMYFAVTSSRPGLWSGAFIGLGALMRYHGGIVLPFFALGLFLTLRADPRRATREVMLCLASASVVTAGIVLYNLVLFGTWWGWSGQGIFSVSHLSENVRFYALALLLIWPLMIFAPLVDRSPVRWLVPAIAGSTVGLFAFYYFYDRGSTIAQTLIVGQRLIQPAIPPLVVSYVLVIDRLLLRKLDRIAPVTRLTIPILLSVTLTIATAAVFRSHQRHLDELRVQRDAIAAIVQPGSLVIANGTGAKLLSIAGQYPFRIQAILAGGEDDRWGQWASRSGSTYLVWVGKGSASPPGTIIRVVEEFGLIRLDGPAGVWVYRFPPVSDGR